MVGADATLPLPWLEAPLRQALAHGRAHALLVHGPQGVGQFELAIALAQAWLCEGDAGPRRPCGRCAACRLVQSHSHPDLLVLLPEALRADLGWGGDEEPADTDRAAKRKPSRDIRVDDVRRAIAFAQTTSARGRGKVVVLHPAERLNGVAANALLKTLEEPPGDARLVLSCAAPDALLPTIRSRCQALALALPETEMASAWLAQQGIDEPAVLLGAAGGQPQDALAWAAEGIDARTWAALPRQIAQGDAAGLAAWPLPRLVDMLHKLCHDLMRLAAGGEPRYFPRAALPAKPVPLARLAPWAKALAAHARSAEHTWNAGLMAEALVQQARQAFAAAASVQERTPSRQGVSVHSIR